MKLPGFLRKKNQEPVCSAVIVAAGSSERMGTDKLMLELGGRPVLAQTVSAFEGCHSVDEIVIVTRSELLEKTAELCKQYGFEKVSRIIAGGATRTESALAGVCAVKSSAKLIAIHDGARPFATRALITRAVEAASKNLSAIPVLPSTDTLKTVNEKGYIIATVDRESTVRVQTPQVFEAMLIKGALTKAVKDGKSYTDDSAAVSYMGAKLFTVEGDEENIKLTAPKDLLFAEAIYNDRRENYADRSRL